METNNEQQCCPEFNPTPWDNISHVWNDKLFIKDSISQVFHIPLPGQFSKVLTKMWKKAQDAGASPDVKDFLCLAYDPSPWKSELYMLVTKEVPDTENVKLSGTFLSKVFDGPYSAIPKFIKEMDKHVAAQDKKVKKYYFYFTTCPKCAKKYGHNYIVAFAEV